MPTINPLFCLNKIVLYEYLLEDKTGILHDNLNQFELMFQKWRDFKNFSGR
jgi:hypothetical protein